MIREKESNASTNLILNLKRNYNYPFTLSTKFLFKWNLVFMWYRMINKTFVVIVTFWGGIICRMNIRPPFLMQFLHFQNQLPKYNHKNSWPFAAETISYTDNVWKVWTVFLYKIYKKEISFERIHIYFCLW